MADNRLLLRRLCATTALVAAACGASAAQAQNEAEEEPNQTASAGRGSPAIVVTAQRREETLFEVPQSMAVVGEETLERQQATNFMDYAPLVPGLSITQENPGESRVIIRGINTNSVGSTVSIYVDESPFGSSGSLSNAGVLAGDFDTFDVQRVEVLRGPQGTLYGSNALGGTLKFVTVEPQLGEFEVRGQGGVEFVRDGGTGWSGNGVVNAPLGEMIAFRASGFYRRNAGYIDAIGRSGTNINESDSYGGRASLLFEPTRGLSIRLTALAQNIETDSASSYEVDPIAFEPVDVLTGQRSDERTRFELIPEFNTVDYRLYNGTIDWDFGAATLTSATSYSTLDQDQLEDISNTGNRDLANALYAPTMPGTVGLAFQNDIRNEKFTQEVRLASNADGPFEWLFGVYYTDESALLFQRFQPFEIATQALLPTELTLAPGFTVPEFVFVTLDSNYEEIAGFGSVTWHLSDDFEITAGGRYSHNEQDSVQFTSIVGTDQTITGDSSESVFTWSVAPRYELSDYVSVYVRVAKGYRPGGPNAVPPGAPPNFLSSFEADTLISYEAGVRASTVDNSFSIDASVYRLDWDNILINTVFIDPATGTQFGANGNGRRARSQGADVIVTMRPADGLTLIANLAFTDAELLDDTTPAPGTPNITGGLAGDPLPFAPDITATLSADYEWLIGDALAYVGANLRLVSDQTTGFSQEFRADFGRLIEIDGYQTIDLRAGVNFDRFSVSAYVRNLTDEDGLVQAGGYPRQIPPVVGGTNAVFMTASSIRPRTFGFTLGFEY